MLDIVSFFFFSFFKSLNEGLFCKFRTERDKKKLYTNCKQEGINFSDSKFEEKCIW